jgi:type IV pilus assembly protein PilB
MSMSSPAGSTLPPAAPTDAGRAPPRIGQTLMARGVVSADQIHIALLEQDRQHQPIGRILIRLGFVSEATLREVLSENSGTRAIDLSHTLIEPQALALLPRATARSLLACPLALTDDGHRLLVATADPRDLLRRDRLRAALPHDLEIEFCQAGESDIVRAIDRHYGMPLTIDALLRQIESAQGYGRGDGATADHEQAVVQLVDSILADAVRRQASDIHFEPEGACLRIRYRIDGILQQVRSLHGSCWAAMAIRLKVVSGMNIADSRSPQDGRLVLAVGGRDVEFRVASLPTLHGENFVLRVLDRHKGIRPLAELGLANDDLQQLATMLARPDGVLLVTGPTGSGKTSTLYSLLNHINDQHLHIMTLEDPVEYALPLVRQVSLADAAGLDFANGARAILRQDPDVVLIGEIRDRETAEVTFRAAMTGHRVLSTLHTGSAIGAIPRLLELGIPHHVLAGNISGIVAQRLVRLLCPACRNNTAPPLASEPPPPIGCPECEHSGYRGRQAILEILRVSREFDRLLALREPLDVLLAQARHDGHHSLAEAGRRLLEAGLTNHAELARVVDLTRESS